MGADASARAVAVPAVAIRRLAETELAEAADLHRRAFPGFFLTALGPAFLRELYRSFAADAGVVALVARGPDGGAMLGLAAGPLCPRGHFRRLLVARWWAFLLAASGAAARDPRVVPRLARALRYRGDPPAGAGRALLSSIAVAPEARRRGIGRALIGAWAREVRARGAAGCYLTTDADDNDRTLRFYERSGWTLAEERRTPEGRRMRVCRLDFDAPCV